MNRPPAAVEVRYRVRNVPESWVLPEEPVAQSVPHDKSAEAFRRILEYWASRTPRQVGVARELAVRWLRETPQVGADPDVCVLEPPPPDFENLTSLCLWKPGHYPPRLCLEVVSTNRPHKDYATIHDRYAALGAEELVVFDPHLAGPTSLGGPVLLQMWQPNLVGSFERTHFSDAPVYSRVLGAWLIPNDRELLVADDRGGRSRWLTAEEYERAEKERERAEKERERAEKEHERAEKERERAEKERERAARLDLEQRLAALEDQARDSR